MFFIILGVVFFIVSFVFSMIGMGGGILYVPILLFAGFSMKQAPAVSLMLIAATSLAALFTFWRNHRVDWKLAAVIDPPTDIMAFVGGYFSSLVPEHILQLILSCVLVVAGVLMLRGGVSSASVGNVGGWWVWRRRFRGEEYSVNIPLVLVATAFIGLLSGMLGITGGIIKLPIMVLLCGVPMDIAVGTSTVMVAVTALSGLFGHAVSGGVDWRVGVVLAVAAVLGGFLGGRVSLSVDRLKLKRGFGVVVLLVAVKVVVGVFWG